MDAALALAISSPTFQRSLPHAKQAQGELFTYWRHHAFITNRTEPMHLLDSEHRQHAVVELVIRDLKGQALAHFPYSAWIVDRLPGAQPLSLDRPAQPVRPDTKGGGHHPAATVQATRKGYPTARRSTMQLPARWPGRPASSTCSSAPGRSPHPPDHSDPDQRHRRRITTRAAARKTAATDALVQHQ